MADRITFVEHHGKRILLEDFTNVREEAEFIGLIQQAHELIATQPLGTALVLVDLTGSHFTSNVSQASKTATAGNTPYLRASCLVGVTGLMEIMARAVSAFAQRELVTFETRDEALDWLAAQ